MWWQQQQVRAWSGAWAQFPAPDIGALGKWTKRLFFITHTLGKTFGGKCFFLEAVTLPFPIFPILSVCGARNYPETSPKVLSPPGERSKGPQAAVSGGPGLPMMPSGPDLGPAHQDLWMPMLSPQKSGWQVPGTGAGALWEGMYSNCK